MTPQLLLLVAIVIIIIIAVIAISYRNTNKKLQQTITEKQAEIEQLKQNEPLLLANALESIGNQLIDKAQQIKESPEQNLEEISLTAATQEKLEEIAETTEAETPEETGYPNETGQSVEEIDNHVEILQPKEDTKPIQELADSANEDTLIEEEAVSEEPAKSEEPYVVPTPKKTKEG